MLRQYVVIPLYWGQSFLPDQHGSLEAVIGPTGYLDLFVIGNDLGVWFNFWDGQWHFWFRIGDPAPSSTFNMATPVEVLVGPTNHLDLFAVGNDGGVWSNFWGNE